MTSAILFSKPSCFWFENGKFSGSAQTRNCFTSTPKAHVATSSMPATIVLVIRGPCRPKGLHYDRCSTDLQVCRESIPYGSANTVSTPPWLLKLATSPNAPSAPRPAVGSSAPISAATPMPDQPPIPDSTATYCLLSGPT